jgi:hypothetical protein
MERLPRQDKRKSTLSRAWELKGLGEKIIRESIRIVVPRFPVNFYPLTNSGNRIKEATSISRDIIMSLECVGFVAHVGICYWYKCLSGSSHQNNITDLKHRTNSVSRNTASLQQRQGTTHECVCVQ